MKNRLAALAIALTAVLIAPSLSCAANAADHSGVQLVSHGQADGMTLGQLLAQIWTLFYETPVSQPLSPCLALGETGSVLHTDGGATCTSHVGQPVMVFFGSTCDTVSTPPFYAVNYGQQRKCAVAADEAFIEYMTLTIDGGPAQLLSTQQYSVFSPQFDFVLPADNGFGLPPGPGTATAHAWLALIENLPVGTHALGQTIKFYGDDPFTIHKTVIVVP
jgi:hypothetical protein